MGFGAGVSLFMFVICGLSWLTFLNGSPGMNVAGACLVTTFGALAVLFRLRHAYRSVQPRKPRRPYVIAAGAVVGGAALLCVLAGALGVMAVHATASEAGTVTTQFSGSHSGDERYIGAWEAAPGVSITTTTWPFTTVTMTLLPESSHPDLDVILVLDDGSEVLCESEKQSWRISGGPVPLDAPCERVVPVGDLEELREVRVAASTRVGGGGLG